MPTDLQAVAERHAELKQWPAALRAYQDLLAAAPESAAAHLGCARALMWLLRREEAAASFDRAAALDPQLFEAHANAGLALRELGRYREAIVRFERALALQPQNVRLREDWLLTLADDQGPEAALAWLDQHGPGEAARTARDEQLLGGLLTRMGRIAAAEAAFERAAKLAPEWAAPRHARGLSRLARRDFDRGWDDYEWRWETGDRVAYRVPDVLRARMLRWPTPEAFDGAEVVLLGEQGVGDVLMFASMIPDVMVRAQHVSLLAEPRLVRLLQNSFPGLAVGAVAADAAIVALGSLGCAFRRRIEDFPSRAYLRPSEAAAERARARLGPRDGRLRIGLSWRGGTGLTGLHRRSVALADLTPVLRQPGVEFVSLQYGDHVQEIAAVNGTLDAPIRTLPAEAVHDFDDLAGVVAELDGVLSVQTALIHLCGGLGVPCRVLVPDAAEWRYGAEGEAMPWYGSVRLVRRRGAPDWSAAIAEAWQDLSRELAGRGRAGFRTTDP